MGNWSPNLTSTFNTGLSKGYDSYEATLEAERKKKEAQLQADLLLRNAQANEGTLGPAEVNQMQLTQGPEGLQFPTVNAAGAPIQFRPKAPDPDELINVDPNKAAILKIKPGLWKRSEVESQLKNYRAEAAAGAPGQRQKEAQAFETKKLPRENMIEAMKSADKAVQEFTKTIPGQIASPETIANVKEKALNDALDSLETAGKPSKSGNPKSAPAQPAGALPSTQGVPEGHLLKLNGVTTHVLKGGKWVPVTK